MPFVFTANDFILGLSLKYVIIFIKRWRTIVVSVRIEFDYKNERVAVYIYIYKTTKIGIIS